KSLYVEGGKVIDMIDDYVVQGKIISSDKEGNIYKSLVIQDETGGIEIKINSSGLYNYFKQGTTVFLRANKLKVGAYGGTLSIGSVPVDKNYENDFIPATVMENYIIKAGKGEPVKPTLLTIPTLKSEYNNMLIKLDNVQFLQSEVANDLTFADGVNQQTENRTLVDAKGNRLVVRTSGYARFAQTLLPLGSGSVTGILTYFHETAQLTIISIKDVQLDKPRFITVEI
ncbi:MAG: hypothetical protein GX857_12790, partial [Bacteroidales bacterium]|nr:hypothetical protein [Bacteroidales bacterium]